MNGNAYRVIASALAGAVVSGCLNLTPPASSAEAHGLALEAKSSACVQVNGPRFQMNRGVLELAGSIAKRPGASSTAFSHLDILFYDRSGTILKLKAIRFGPRSVGHSRFSSQVGYYSLKLETLPEGATLIGVQAHDADISAPHG